MKIYKGQGNVWEPEDGLPTCNFCKKDIMDVEVLYDTNFNDVQCCDEEECLVELGRMACQVEIESECIDDDEDDDEEPYFYATHNN